MSEKAKIKSASLKKRAIKGYPYYKYKNGKPFGVQSLAPNPGYGRGN